MIIQSKKHNRRLKQRTLKKSKRKKRLFTARTKTVLKRCFIIAGLLTAMAGIAAGLIFLAGKIFAVNEICVEGNEKYDDSEIIRASEIKSGDNLILLNSRSAEEKIYKSFSYIDGVRIEKEFPRRVRIITQTGSANFAFDCGDEYCIVSANDKLVAKCAEVLPETIKIVGVDIEISDLGMVTYQNEDAKNLIFNIVDSFKSHELNSICEIDISDPDCITACYDARIKIIMGTVENIEYKVITAKEIVTNKIGTSEKGSLDLRSLKESNRSYFNPEE